MITEKQLDEWERLAKLNAGSFSCDIVRTLIAEVRRLNDRLTRLAIDAILAADPDLDGPLPELTPDERAAMDALPVDFIERVLRGERPLQRKEATP